MTEQWGRSTVAGTWPHPRPVWTLVSVIVALATTVAVEAYEVATDWTPLQRTYLASYVRSAVLGELGITTGRYRLLHVVDRRGSRMALDEEVRPTTTAAGISFALTEAAMRAGDRQLMWGDASYRHTTLHAFLGRWIYRDQTLTALVGHAARAGVALLIVGMLVAIPVDVTRGRERRQGRRLKGPELISAARFNRRVRADGVGFKQSCSHGRGPWVRVPRALESSHFLIMGDSGTGKSALIRQLLQQLDARGEPAIVYDPALEYTGQFYTPARGDLILNPLDARSPFWSPGDEWQHEAETLTLATSLFPDRFHDHTFFTDAPRRIFAHLLTFRPTPQQLAAWLCQPTEIDARVKGTPYVAMIDPQAPAQRAGVLASLNMVADTLKLLPAERETTQHWSAAAWATTRTGWLFLTSTPETRPRLVPLTSLWLDTLVLRLMNQGQTQPRRTWFVLDELASLQRLPQLHTAITENRKSNNPLVLGFQGRSQLETRYGHDAEAMLSQPATKIFLRTSEPHAAKWIADTIGDIETERLCESRSSGRGRQQSYGLERRSSGRGRQQSYGLERHVEPLVMPSEISGLPALRGYLKVGNLVVRLRFPFEALPARAVAFQERRRARPAEPARPAPRSSEGSDASGITGRRQDHRQQVAHEFSIE
jgi:type IV secretory pathway TraG/TraD family ATPase VirD4